MPQIQVLPALERDPDPNGVQKFFSKIGEYYNDKQDRTTVGRISKEYSEHANDVGAFQKYMSELESANLSPSNYVKARQNALDVEDKLVARGKMLNDQAKAAATKGKESAFQKARGAAAGKEVEKIETEMPKYEDANINLNRISQLAEGSLSGGTGWVKGVINTGDAKELETLSAAGLDPIIRIFNPTGMVAQKKLEWINKTFGIKATERKDTIKGKVKARKQLNDQAIRRMQEHRNLLIKYDGNVPPDIEEEFKQETEAQTNAIADQAAFEVKLTEAGEDGKIKGLYTEDGHAMEPLDAAEAKDLFEAGAITTIPPVEKKAQQKAAATSYKEGQIANGPNGQKLIFKGGKWQPV